MRVVILSLAFLLAACGPSVDATELGGVARWNGASPGPAVSAANAHCQRYGRTARVTQIEAWTGYVAFSCERPS
jgi:hypothetical protein